MSRIPFRGFIYVLFGITVGVVPCSGCVRSQPSNTPSSRADGLVPILNKALAAGRNTSLSASRHTPWELLHAGLGMGLNSTVKIHAEGEEQLITLLQYFERGGPWRGQCVYVQNGNDVFVRTSVHAYELEKHPDQFLAYFGQMGLATDTRLRADNRIFTIADMVTSAKRRVSPYQETTFTLLALSAYSDAQETWTNDGGEKFSLAFLAEIELERDPRRLSCGGSHSILALSRALTKARQCGCLGEEVWSRVRERLGDEWKAVHSLQAEDGSLRFRTMVDNTDGFSRMNRSEMSIFMTGHTLEWVLTYCEEAALEFEWLCRAVRFLSDQLLERALNPTSFSGWFHALHALKLYQQRRDAAARTRKAPKLGRPEGSVSVALES